MDCTYKDYREQVEYLLQSKYALDLDNVDEDTLASCFVEGVPAEDLVSQEAKNKGWVEIEVKDFLGI